MAFSKYTSGHQLTSEAASWLAKKVPLEPHRRIPRHHFREMSTTHNKSAQNSPSAFRRVWRDHSSAAKPRCEPCNPDSIPPRPLKPRLAIGSPTDKSCSYPVGPTAVMSF